MNQPAPDSDGELTPSGEGPRNSAEVPTVINGVFVGVGGVYAATGSVLVAGIAGVAAVSSAWLGAWRHGQFR